MKKAISTLALSLSLLTLVLSADALAATSTAKIDGKCSLHTATLTVPAGKTATGFKVTKLAKGRLCKTNQTPDNKGWGITKAGAKVYYWNKFKANAPTVKGGPLSKLTLGAGTYRVFVDGGAGAVVVVQYTLK